MSVTGDWVILGGGGESTSNSDEEDLLLECEWLRDLDLDLVLPMLRFEGESHEIKDFAWYTASSSSSSSSEFGFSISLFTPNFISSGK